jgi:hypothetical protein
MEMSGDSDSSFGRGFRPRRFPDNLGDFGRGGSWQPSDQIRSHRVEHGIFKLRRQT